MNSARGIYYIVLAAFAAAGARVAEHMGGWDGLTKLLAYAMAIDYLTGVLCAIVWHRSPKSETGCFESRAGFKGLVRKGVMLLIVVIAAELDKLTGANAMRTAVILFFVANDGMSILENLGIMGVPYPPALKNAFEVLRRKSKDTGADEDKGEDGGSDDGGSVPTVDTDSQEVYHPLHELSGDPCADLKDGPDADFLDGMPDEDGEQDG